MFVNVVQKKPIEVNRYWNFERIEAWIDTVPRISRDDNRTQTTHTVTEAEVDSESRR